MGRFTLVDRGGTGDFAESVRRGLTSKPKSLEPRFFYDPLGSALFDAICHLPEYYVTRAEWEVLSSRAEEIVTAAGLPDRIIEIGSGSARKTRLLLDALASRKPAFEYVPIDIDAATLTAAGRLLLQDFPSMTITAVAADFRDPSHALAGLPRSPGRTLVLFLGSTIGNLDPGAAVAMLQNTRRLLAPGDALLLGADLRKPKAVLEPAYDDPLGVTAAFNLNLLQRINRELGGHFRLLAFSHLAFFNEEESRIEMHLVSRERQSVAIDALGITVPFEEGESIHTENSYKYDDVMMDRFARESHFEPRRTWFDSHRWFADVLLGAV
ncbi:MAG TPA: L-histidine N(alpha)-methyltransferase [Thermoanaerobaculia bacterium]|nr:L-histidine N(alpha)-methyltransferase [Thermoanaerobaculia bacterium]